LPVLRDPVSRCDKGIADIAGNEDVLGQGCLRAAVEQLYSRAVILVRQRVLLYRAFEGLVMFREGTVRKARTKYAADTVGLHYKGKFAVLCCKRRSRPVRDITLPDTGLIIRRIDLRWVPFYHCPLWIPRLAFRVDRCAVIDYPPVDRPGPGPCGIEAYSS